MAKYKNLDEVEEYGKSNRSEIQDGGQDLFF